jgi:hypothetical protein
MKIDGVDAKKTILSRNVELTFCHWEQNKMLGEREVNEMKL